ncbi:YafY family transcriptional regulator [Phytoactinopolyspora halotolerans]|uniref:YafY family transcriptional regulator n=2 Tax=Phytoactinopolyspora halotolerans TaxID=1981512 RepID=A0A6L9SBI1_9ACTN|nr:YafY family transcriptional regulator [Phytoactinopolyspora halotolerans]
MLALLSVLQNGQEFSGAELARRLETSPRTLRRDVERLRELGYPVQTQAGPGGYYRLVAGSAMPPLLLNDDEAVAVGLGLRLAAQVSLGESADDAASGALRKLEQVLPARLRRTMAAVLEATETGAGRAPAEVRIEVLSAVGRAIQRRERIRFVYTDREGAASRRDVEPYRQVLSRQRWYLLAWDLERHGWRTFRLDRISDVEATGRNFAPRRLPADTAAEYVEASFREPRIRAVITFHAPIDQVGNRFFPRDGVLESIDDARCRYTAWVDSLEWLAVIVAIRGIDFTVEQPPEFTEYCRELSGLLARAATS